MPTYLYMTLTGETKFFIGIIITTIIIIAGAIFFLGGSSSSKNPVKKVDASLLIRDDSAKVSSSSAVVTLVEFSDFQCPACGAYFPIVSQLKNEFKDKMNFVYRNFPLNQHKNAKVAAYAAEASGLQGKYWQMHDDLFGNQTKWSELNNAKDIFIEYAQKEGLNIDKFKKGIDSDGIKQKVDRDVVDGTALGVDSTPTFYLNGEKLENPGSFEDFKTLVKAAILKNPISQAPTEKYHVHADFKVYINNNPIDFSQAKYQSKEDKELDPYLHLHDGNGNILHVHKKGLNLDRFFQSFKISLTNECLNLDTGEKYCTSGGKTLKMYVNGKINTQFASYEPQDLDRILLSYGNDSEEVIQKQVSSVTDDACKYSLKCPERGKPPTENCAGGLGTGCED